MPGLTGGLPRRYPVQGDGDGTHVVLGQHQPEQQGKFLQLHGGVPQQQGALLQTAAEDVPQLPVLLRQGGPLPLNQQVHPLLQPVGQADVLQKGVKGNRLPPSRPVLILPQPLQRGGHPPPDAVHQGQQGPVLLGPLHPVALGVPGPVLALGPAAAPDVPLQDVVLQQVNLLLGQAGETGL